MRKTRGPVSIRFLLPFAAKISFSCSLFLSSLFRLYHHRSSLLSPSTSLQRSRGFDAAVGLASRKYTALANVELPWGTKEERSRKGGGLQKRRRMREDIGERAEGGGSRGGFYVSPDAQSFVAKLLYRPAIITGRVVGYSTKDTARL